MTERVTALMLEAFSSGVQADFDRCMKMAEQELGLYRDGRHLVEGGIGPGGTGAAEVSQSLGVRTRQRGTKRARG